MNKKIKSFSTQKRNRLIFYIAVLILPMIQIAIFYFYANVRSFTLAFTKYDGNGNYDFAGLEVFKDILTGKHTIFTNFKINLVIKNSLITFIAEFLLGSFPAILFSYYIFKKHPLGQAFKIILYIPQIVSALVFVIIYKYFMNDLLPKMGVIEVGFWEKTLDAERFYYLFFTIFFSFGTRVLLYSGTMSGISDSIIESGKIEGITPLKELFFIVLPMIWGTFVTFTITAIIGLFTNQMSGYAFKGSGFNSQLQTFGYFIFSKTADANLANYPILSALGLFMTLIAVPITLLVRYLLTRFGPKTE